MWNSAAKGSPRKAELQETIPGYLLLLAGIGIVLRLLAHRLSGGLFIDDTYIYLRYAENFRAGLGLVYNQGEIVMGFTSPLYMYLLAALAKMLPDATLIAFLPWLGILCYLVGLWFIWRLLTSFSQESALFGAMIFTVWFAFVDSSIEGMETPLFLLGILGMWEAHLKGRSVVRGVWGGVTGLTRPEGVILFGVLLAVAAFRRFTSALISAVIAAVMGLGWFILAITQYGSILPNSALAKASTSLNAVHSFADLSLYISSLLFGLPDTVFLRMGVLATSVLGLLCLILLAWFLKRHLRAISSMGFLLTLSLLAYISFYLLGHPGRLFSWYGVPSCLCFVLLLSITLPTGILRILRKPSVATTFAIGLILISMTLQSYRSARIRESVGGRYQKVADWLQSNTNRDDLVATGDIGLIGWASKRKILDLGALVSRDLALEHSRSDSVFIGDLMDTYHPRVFILDRSLKGESVIKEDFIHYALFRTKAQRRRWQEEYELRHDTSGMGKAIYWAPKSREDK